MVYLHIGLSVLAFVSALLFPFWITILLALVLIAVFEAWEVIFLGVLIDFLYLPGALLWVIPMPATLSAILLLFLASFVRERMLIGKRD